MPKRSFTRLSLFTLTLLSLNSYNVRADPDPKNKWCGKYYEAEYISLPPVSGGDFVYPSSSDTPLLDLSCASRYSYFLSPSSKEGEVIVDASWTNYTTATAVAWNQTALVELIEVEVKGPSGQTLATTLVEPGSKGNIAKFSLEALGNASFTPYDLTCSFSSSFKSITQVSFPIKYLPPNPNQGASAARMDWLTGMTSVLNGTKIDSGEWETIFPYGFYSSYSYLVGNWSLLEEYKNTGFNMIHLEPTYGNHTEVDSLFEYCKQLGLWVIYDMRNTYMNLTSVTEQVNYAKTKDNLLMWYTADEGDGQMDDFNASTITYDLIYQLDGYHPVSLVMNCYDYFWSTYAAGADVISQDAYPVSINGSWDYERHLVVNETFGDAGCDECWGYNNISQHPARIPVFEDRALVTGRSRNLSVWSVPQAFGASEYWQRIPTAAEYITMAVGALSQGAGGIMPWFWDGVTPTVMKNAAKVVASYVDILTPLLWDSSKPASLLSLDSGTTGVFAGVWKLHDGGYVVVLSNPQNTTQTYSIDAGFLPSVLQQTLFTSEAIKNSTEALATRSWGGVFSGKIDAVSVKGVKLL